MKRKTNPVIVMLIGCAMLPSVLIACLFLIIGAIRNTATIRQDISAAVDLQVRSVESFFQMNDEALDILTQLVQPQRVLQMTAEQHRTDVVPLDVEKVAYSKAVDNAREILDSWIMHQPALDRVSIVDMSNQIIVSSKVRLEGQKSQLEDRYLARICKGEVIVTRLFEDAYADNAMAFIIAKPLMQDENCLGFLMLSVRPEALGALFKDARYFETGEVALLDVGNLKVACSDATCQPGSHEDEIVNQQLNNHIESRGSFAYRQQGEKYLAHYVRFEETGWTVLCTVQRSEFNIPAWRILLYALLFIGIVLIFVVLMRRAIIMRFEKPMNGLLDNLHQMEEGGYSERIPYLGNNEFTVIGASFNRLMARVEHDNRELAIKEERYRIANEQSNSVIFEYNVENSAFTCSPNACEFAAYPAFTKGFPESIVELGVLHSEEAAQFSRLFTAMTHGRRQGAMELRIRTYRDEFHWYSLLLTTIIDTTTFKPLRVVGKLTDIDQEKKMTANLTFKAERDPLTSIYNKSTTQSLISQLLAERQQDAFYALIVMDVDNFKGINDNYGHQKGDAVLMEIASTLASQLRGEDIVGRIGGDEFMIVLSAMPSREAVGAKASRLLAELRKIMLCEAEGVHLTCSMGVALCPKDGVGFSQLYASADNALYVRKRAGKDGYSFYREESEQ